MKRKIILLIQAWEPIMFFPLTPLATFPLPRKTQRAASDMVWEPAHSRCSQAWLFQHLEEKHKANRATGSHRWRKQVPSPESCSCYKLVLPKVSSAFHKPWDALFQSNFLQSNISKENVLHHCDKSMASMLQQAVSKKTLKCLPLQFHILASITLIS